MKIQVVSGVGVLMVILPAFWLGVSYLDNGALPALPDFRWILILIGVLLLILSNLLNRRAVAGEE